MEENQLSSTCRGLVFTKCFIRCHCMAPLDILGLIFDRLSKNSVHSSSCHVLFSRCLWNTWDTQKRVQPRPNSLWKERWVSFRSWSFWFRRFFRLDRWTSRLITSTIFVIQQILLILNLETQWPKQHLTTAWSPQAPKTANATDWQSNGQSEP